MKLRCNLYVMWIHLRCNLDAIQMNLDVIQMQSRYNLDTIQMQFRCNQDEIQLECIQLHLSWIKILIKSQINTSKAGYNQDAILTKSEIHAITSKLDQNINQKPDQQIKNQINRSIARSKMN